MKISITLPSLYPHACERALDNLRDATRNPYQVVVVSPFEPPTRHVGPKLIWIKEDQEQSNGCNAGHARALRHLDGDFVMAWVDDHMLLDGWDVLAIRRYEEREKQNPLYVMGLRHVHPSHVGTEFGIYYPYFPFQRLSCVKRVGWYDPAYKRGFADGDLAFRVWDAGGLCEWSDERLITVHEDDSRKDGVIYDPADMDLFLQRWGRKYGAGWDTTTLRGFNIDVVPEDHPSIVKEFTIFHNKPAFRDAALAGGWRP